MTTFTPTLVKQKRRRIQLALLFGAALCPILFFNLTTPTSATTSTTWQRSELAAGTASHTTIADEKVQLAPTSVVKDESTDDFSLGNNVSDGFAMTAYPEEGGVEINQGYVYNTQTSPGLANNYVVHTFLDNDL